MKTGMKTIFLGLMGLSPTWAATSQPAQGAVSNPAPIHTQLPFLVSSSPVPATSACPQQIMVACLREIPSAGSALTAQDILFGVNVPVHFQKDSTACCASGKNLEDISYMCASKGGVALTAGSSYNPMCLQPQGHSFYGGVSYPVSTASTGSNDLGKIIGGTLGAVAGTGLVLYSLQQVANYVQPSQEQNGQQDKNSDLNKSSQTKDLKSKLLQITNDKQNDQKLDNKQQVEQKQNDQQEKLKINEQNQNEQQQNEGKSNQIDETRHKNNLQKLKDNYDFIKKELNDWNNKIKTNEGEINDSNIFSKWIYKKTNEENLKKYQDQKNEITQWENTLENAYNTHTNELNATYDTQNAEAYNEKVNKINKNWKNLIESKKWDSNLFELLTK